MDTSIQFDSNFFIQQDEKIYASDETYQGYLPSLDVAEENPTSLLQNYPQSILEIGYIENNSHLFPGSVIEDFEVSENSMDIDAPLYNGRNQYQSNILPYNNSYNAENDMVNFLNNVFGKYNMVLYVLSMRFNVV